MNDTTTQDTLIDRAVSAMTEAIMEADSSATWLSTTARLLMLHLAAELIVLEELAGQPLTLQDACRFLCAGAEGKA
jgi:hypothetical protein